MSGVTGKTAAEVFMQEKRDELRKARQRVERLEDALRHYVEIYNIISGVPSRESSGDSRDVTVKSGSQAEKVRRVLIDAGEPVHIDEIMARMGVENTMAAKNSLAGSLSRYVRQGQMFTRPARGTFGLIEWSDEPDQKTDSDVMTRPSLADLVGDRTRQSAHMGGKNLL